jgi:hypothetical protein
MVAALVERTGHSYRELMELPYEDVLQMNVDVLAREETKEKLRNKHMNTSGGPLSNAKR